MKRLFDIAAAACALLVLALPLLVVIWMVRRKLGSPVFFTQVRPGMHCKPFKMVKFRSMTSERGADGELLPDAVRLTPFGRFLRSTSLDELPEFPRAALEALRELGVHRQLRREHLQRDGSLKLRVERAIHARHSAAPDLCLDLIAAQLPADQICQRGLPEQPAAGSC